MMGQQTVRADCETAFDGILGGGTQDLDRQSSAGRFTFGAHIAIERNKQAILSRQHGKQESVH
jgi:hypothetical protein